MEKKYAKFFLIFLLIGGFYLYLAHAFIYYRIKAAGLMPPPRNDSYELGGTAFSQVSRLYVALGDSLTAGVGVADYRDAYPYLVAQKMSVNKRVILKNFSYPGARSGDLIENQLASAMALKPDIITLLIGINDIHGNIPTDIFIKNYRYILGRLTTETKAKIYLIGIPLIGSDELLLPPYNTYFQWRTEVYNKIIQRLATDFKAQYINLNNISDRFKQDKSLYAADSFHPSKPGYSLWSQIIYADINR